MKKFLSLALSLLYIFNCIPASEAKLLKIYEDNPQEICVLRKSCNKVVNFDNELSTLVCDMKETMKKYGGVGLAAPQVGKSMKIFVAQTPQGVKEFINPYIEKTSDNRVVYEACLSIPGRAGFLLRPNNVSGYAWDANGKKFNFSYTGITAQTICHEDDHLYGILYTDSSKLVMTNGKLAALSVGVLIMVIGVVVATVKSVSHIISKFRM